ncbi:MAG: two-component system, OmpR family, alkaline phosphatase synthesis response regulator PhoP [Chloroflexota bacterium]|jgi:DNA-binding response OmpR family regulator|nr:two-component system, OmpR family, alkaline phosphatase synthesis response regulator PhoP [Chloroflexota bacterium]
MPEATVLVVDDERNVTQLVRMYLTNEGYHVETASNGIDALEKAKTTKPDLVVLDLMMPGIDGWEVCRRLRSEGELPIIMLTARGDDVDKIVGLELGADDYLTKPFNPRELVARVKAVLRRYQGGKKPPRLIELDGLRIDTDGREVRVNSKVVDLRPKEFDLLVTLARAPGVVYDRERLIHLVWGYDYVGDTRTVDVHVAGLRDKIEGSAVRIQTVWSVGYKLVTEKN